MSEFPKRKNIRLKNFDYSENGYYYITICTYKRQKLFEKSTVGAFSVWSPDRNDNKMVDGASKQIFRC